MAEPASELSNMAERASEPSSTADLLPSFRLDGRVVLLTGASSGLGARFARILHASGAEVVVAARRLDRLEKLAAELDGTRAIACDVADPVSLRNLVETTLAETGRIDVLVNNAGLANPMPAEDEPLEVFREVLEVNLVGLFHLSQLTGRAMLAAGHGVIVNVASILGLVASGQLPQAGYVASKGAVVNLTRELACQWARKGVRVNALAPGFFPSESSAEIVEGPTHDFIVRQCPMARIGEEHELDGPLLFLASDASSYCTGHVLTVDGGWTAR
jgi:NAD(P)-dependent dehydrogenase (short-subunit alcohol dehydrogenase family)